MKALLTLILMLLLFGTALSEPDLGRELYLKHCQTCHGPEGQGDGPTAPYLPVTPRDLTRRPYKNGCGPGAVVQTVKEGFEKSGMPAFKSTLTEAEIWSLAHYVRSLQGGCP